MRRQFQLDVATPFVFYSIVVGGIYLLLAGHNQPGGGFVGGLVCGAAVALRYITGGLDEVRRITPFAPWTILGFGLLTAAGTAAFPLFLGEPFLSTGYRAVELPLFGSASFTSATLFDFGVFLVVIGLILMIFEAFGLKFEPEDQ